MLDGAFFDLLPPFNDGRVPSEVDVGRCEIAEAFMVSAVVVMLDEGVDLVFKVSGQVIVFQQDAVCTFGGTDSKFFACGICYSSLSRKMIRPRGREDKIYPQEVCH